MRLPFGYLLVLPLLLVACEQSRKPDASFETTPTSPESIQCTNFGGFSEKICPVSIIQLIANPHKYHNRIIFVRGYLQAFPQSGYDTVFVFPSKEWVTGEGSTANSFTCVPSSGQASCGEIVEHSALLFGRFLINTQPSDELHRPIGSMRLMYARSFEPELKSEPAYDKVER